MVAALLFPILSPPTMDGEEAVSRARAWLARVGVRDRIAVSHLSYGNLAFPGTVRGWQVGFRSPSGRSWSVTMQARGTVLQMNSSPAGNSPEKGDPSRVANDLLRRAAGAVPVRLDSISVGEGLAHAKFGSRLEGRPLFNLNPFWGVLMTFDPGRQELLSYLRQLDLPPASSTTPRVSGEVARTKLVAWAKSHARTNTVAGWLAEQLPGSTRTPRIELGYYRFKNQRGADLVYRLRVAMRDERGKEHDLGPIPVYVDARTGALRDHDDPLTGGKP